MSQFKNESNGMVDVWHIEDKKWFRAFRVDAIEMARNGTVSLRGPEIAVVGPAGSIMTTAEEWPGLQARGYRLASEAEESKTKPDEKSTISTKEKKKEEERTPYDFHQHSVQELREFAARAGIKDSEKLGKGGLVAALDASGFVPDSVKK